ncbi:MAG: 50S ribosomal protein L35 [Planctomycetota bacterium]|jgi:large subunit ribosomal protein L35
MPKLKPHKGATKRFRITKNGKVVATGAGAAHLKASKTAKRRRRLRKPTPISGTEAKRIKRLLGLM